MTDSCSKAIDQGWFNPFDQAYLHDPFPAISALHQGPSVFLHESLGLYIVNKYKPVKSVLKNADTFSSKVFGFLPPPPDLAPQLRDFTDHEMLLGMDRPEHPALRQPLASVFTHKLVLNLEPAVREFASRLIDSFIADGHCELMSQYSYPLALSTIINVFGVPEEHSAIFRKWSDDFMTMLTLRRAPDGEAESAQPMPPEELREHWTSLLAAKEYFRDYVARLRNEPKQDVFSTLLALRDQDGNYQVSDATALLNIPNLIAAGHDTTANVIGQGAMLLCGNPDQRQLLLDDMTLMPNAIEEILRMRGSALGLLRRAKTDVVIDDVNIPGGSIVYALLNGAGFDGDQFEDAGRFDIHRANADQHVAFGIGRHSCIGAQLARMQARVALEELVRRVPNFSLSATEAVTYSPILPLRLTTCIPLRW